MVGEITNYKLKDYIKKPQSLIEEYSAVLLHLEPKQTKKELFYMELGFVDYVKRTFNVANLNEIVDMLTYFMVCDTEDVMEMHIVDFYGYIKSIQKQLDDILHLEANRLVSEHVDMKWEAVNGSERMAPFGIYNTLDRLSGGDITKWDELLKQPYDKVFTKLFMDTVKGDLQKQMSKIKIKTN